jgi:glycosyltransferase involved in cell wall biosynthesis
MRDVPEPVCLVLMGRGFEEYTTRLSHLIGELRLQRRVFLHPYVPYHLLHEYSCSADIGILLYRNDCRNNYYCAPNKLYEYLQAGLPVITSAFPGLLPVVEALDIGRCVDPESPAEIAKAIRALCQDTEAATRKERILTLAREKFRWEREFPNILRLYETLEMPYKTTT